MKAYLEYGIIPTDRLNDTFELKEPEEDLTQYVTKESDIGDIFRYILMYVFGMLSFIYILILWLNKYT